MLPLKKILTERCYRFPITAGVNREEQVGKGGAEKVQMCLPLQRYWDGTL